MNKCCIKTMERMMAKIKADPFNTAVAGAGCPRCHTYITVEVREGVRQ